MVRFGERLTQAERKRDFAIGQMADDLADAPLAGRGRGLDAARADLVEQRRKASGGGRDHLNGILRSQIGCVGFIGNDVSIRSNGVRFVKVALGYDVRAPAQDLPNCCVRGVSPPSHCGLWAVASK